MDDARTGPSTAPETDVDVQVEHPDSRYTASGGSWLCCVPCYWLRRNNSVHKASLGVATLLVTSLLVASPVLFLISAVPASDVPRDCRVQVDDSCLYVGEGGLGPSILGSTAGAECSEPACLAAAARLLTAMDRRADPCSDFYQFSCGRWTHSARQHAGMGLSLGDMQGIVDKHIQHGCILYVGEGGLGPSILGSTAGAECSEPACLAAAARLLTAMDRRADPCSDFYQFSCGRWTHSARQHAGMGLSLGDMQGIVDKHIQHILANSTGSGVFHKLGLFYRSCLAVKDKPVTMAPMYALLDELGGYLPPGSLGPSDLTPLLGRLLRLNGAPLVDVRLESDPSDPSRLAVFVDVPRRGGTLGALLAFRATQHYQEQSVRLKREEPKGSRAYVYIKETAEEKRLVQMDKLLTDFLPKKMITTQRAKEAQSILLFSNMLSKLYPREKDVVSLLQQTDSYQPYNMTRLQTMFPLVKWGPLFEDVLSWNSSENDVVYVMSPGYLSSLTTMVARFQKRVVHNALLLLFARDRLSDLLNSTGRDQSRFCSRLTTGVFSQAVSALYVRQYPTTYLRALEERVGGLFTTLKSTLAARMRAALWLDQESRHAALEKLRLLRGRFITWEMFENQSYVQGLMEDVQVDPDDFFGNVIHRYKQIRTISIDLYNQSQNSKTYAFPFIVNAYYEPRENAIMIPLALLTQPQFRGDIPSCMVHGTLGSILAHELLHGFDLHGARYDAQGRLRDWLAPEARLGLEARVDCLARQYAKVFRKQVKFMGNKVDIQFDWNITRNENMADIGALQTAQQAWRQSQITKSPGAVPERLAGVTLGPRQLFFVSAAQMYCSVISAESYIMSVEVDFHAPYPERVNGIMMNSPSFSEAFSCPIGSPMNPLKKCSTW